MNIKNKLLFISIFTFIIFILISISTIANPYDDVISYYKFNNDLYDTNSQYNLSVGLGTENYGDGVIGNSFYFVESRLQNLSVYTSNYINTLDFWLYLNNTINTQRIFSFQNEAATDYFVLIFANGGLYLQSAGDNCTYQVKSLTNLSKDKWYHIVIYSDGTYNKLWINATLQIEQECIESLGYEENFKFYLGAEGGGGNKLNGSIDNLFISSSAYTSANLTYSYNNGNGREFDAGDSTFPRYSDFKINNTSAKYGESINFSVDLSDETALNAYIFSANATGSWINTSSIDISGTDHQATNISTIAKTKNNVICGYFYFNDSSGNGNTTNVSCFTVANTPVIAPSSIIWITEGGFTSGTRSYGQTIMEINATCTDDHDGDLEGCNITVTNPSGTVVVDNEPMGNISSNFNYTQDITLNSVGDWTINITSFDSSGTKDSLTETITVEITQPTLFDGYYAYDYYSILQESQVTSEFDSYVFDTMGFTLNWSLVTTNLTNLNDIINFSKENNSIKSFIRLYFDGNYSVEDAYTNITCAGVNSNLSVWQDDPYDEAIIFLLVDLNDSADYKVNFSNMIAECLVNATSNNFPIYVELTSIELDSNWISTYSLTTISAQDNTTLINLELNHLRNSTSLTRVYYNLLASQKGIVKSYHDDIITKIRGVPVVTSLDNRTIAEISNGDIIAFNNGTSTTEFVLNISGNSREGKDIWDSTNKLFIEADTDGEVRVNITAFSFVNLYFDNIDHLTLTDVFGSDVVSNLVYSWNRTGELQATYAIVGANDAMFYGYDPAYGHNNQFMIHYEWINNSRITNYSDYCDNGVIIIADKNSEGINDTINCSDKSGIFGYVSVADYIDSDEWLDNKTEEIDYWLDEMQISVFLNGLDTGASGNNFAERFRNLVDHIEIEKNKSCIANDYTSYADAGVGGICEYDMKESFCSRWAGTVSSPTYSWEDFDIDLERAKWARTTRNPQLAMAFGSATDYGKLAYCYAEYLVLFGTSNDNLYKYGQPDFQSQQDIFTFDAGTQLENTWTKVNDSYYYRKYSVGDIWIDPTLHEFGIENNIGVHNLTFSVKAQIYAATPAQSTPISIDLNGQNIGTIAYSDIGSSQWDAAVITKDITSYYNQTGVYVFRFHSQTPANPTGLNIYNTKYNRTGVFSFYDNSVNNPPADGSTDWTAYGRAGINSNYETTNWFVYLNSNSSTSQQIDSGITDISQHIANSTTQTNITINSTYSYNITVWSNIINISSSSYLNLTYFNGSSYCHMNPIDDTSCNTNSPLWGSDTIDGEIHQSCIDTSDSGRILLRLGIPSLSSRLYSIESPQLAINVSSPSNNSINSTNFTVIFSAISNSANQFMCRLFVNGSENSVNRSIDNNITSYLTSNISSQGYYLWKVACNDSYLELNSSEYRIQIYTPPTTETTISISNPDDADDSPSNPASPYDEPFVPLEQPTKLDEKDTIPDSIKAAKEYIIDAVSSPSGIFSGWNQLDNLDKILVIGFLVLIIVSISGITIGTILAIKNQKKDKKNNKISSDAPF